VIDVVGISAVGWSSLGSAERQLVAAAGRLLGSQRQLDLIPPVPGQQRISWPSPLRPALSRLLAGHEETPTVVLASGDPLLAGIGSTLIDIFGPAAVRVHPAVSSEALARARMGWSAESVEMVRLIEVGGDVIRRFLSPGRRLLVLSRDSGTPAEVARVLREAGFGPSRVTVLSELGGPQEAAVELAADDLFRGPPRGSNQSEHRFPDLNIVCVTCRTDRVSALWSTVPGLPDDAYAHDGQLSKREVRASALAQLRPSPGELLWDVGAGAGSVGIEWLRSHPTCRAIAIERDQDRAARIKANAARLGVPGLAVLEGSAPAALIGLESPDAVFVGGGVSRGSLDAAWNALVGGGRLVVHAVTLQTEQLILDYWRRLGGELSRISVEQLRPIGSHHGWQPARAVVQWSVQKHLADAAAGRSLEHP
jgi:precorrin-6Y C5,15-methyltransferase (decarboxylating)